MKFHTGCRATTIRSKKFYKKIGYDGNYHNIVHGKSIRTDLNFEGMRVLIMSDNWYDTGTNRGGGGGGG